MIQTITKRLTSLSPHYFSSYLLKNGRVVNSEWSQITDVLIQQGKISSIGINITHKTAEVIECSNKLIIPGGIDTHTHMQLPLMGTVAADDFDSGSKAAIAGGTTSFIDFAIPAKGETQSSAYYRWRNWADAKVNCDYALHSAIIEWTKDTKDQMKKMVQNGITSFKFFMAYNNVFRIDDIALYHAFQTARDLGALCVVHAENGDLIEMNTKKLLDMGITGPEGHYLSRKQSVEAEAVHRVITIAQSANVPLYIVHLMSKQASQEVQRAKNKGLLVYGETLAATLGTDGTKLWDSNWDIAARYVMSPCLSPDPTTKTQMMKYLQSGVIDVVGTDNCTFCKEQKRLGIKEFSKIPNGVHGVQDRLAIVWTKGVQTGLLSQNQFVAVTSTNAAKIFNLYPKKGVIRVGADADIVIWNPKYKHTISSKTHHHKTDFNIFQGLEVHGGADLTFSHGRLVWNKKQFYEQHKGQYIERKPFGFVYARHENWTKTNNPLNWKVDRIPTQSKISNSKNEQNKNEIQQLKEELRKIKKQRAQLPVSQNNNNQINQFYDKTGQFTNLHTALKTYLPQKIFTSIHHQLYGTKTQQLNLQPETRQKLKDKNIQIKHYKIHSQKQQIRKPRIIKIAGIQNKIVQETTMPVQQQKFSIMKRIQEIIEVAALEQVNVVGLQEIWYAPFFMCTRERYPWIQFAEPINGESTQFLSHLAQKYNMVIISSILERDDHGVLHNSAVVIDNHGDILGKQEKGHIPRVGDFNESSYYMEGQSGHPVFQTQFGNIGINICYGRHHPLNWLGFALNGAQIVFNPSATTSGLSEPLWSIQARNAAIANSYFTVGINRVGTEHYPNEFTSGDGAKAKKDFGHFYGSTYVTAPDGSRTPSLSRTNDGILITEIDLNLCQQVKDKWLFTMTGRHKLYADLLTKYCSPTFQPQRIKKNTKK